MEIIIETGEYFDKNLIPLYPNRIGATINDVILEDGQYGKRYLLKINTEIKGKTENGKIGVSKSSLQVCVASFGKDSDGWVGKEVKLLRKMIDGKNYCIAVPNETEKKEIDKIFRQLEHIQESIKSRESNGDNPGKEEAIEYD